MASDKKAPGQVKLRFCSMLNFVFRRTWPAIRIGQEGFLCIRGRSVGENFVVQKSLGRLIPGRVLPGAGVPGRSRSTQYGV